MWRSSFENDPCRAQLLLLYREVDALLSDVSCDASTECCRFGITGREPYPTAVERAELGLALVRRGLRPKASGGRRARGARRRSLPIVEERRCPLLSEEGLCTVYAARPFGCRTFFCERARDSSRGAPRFSRDEVQRISRAIADLSARFDPVDPGPRPLTRALDVLLGGHR